MRIGHGLVLGKFYPPHAGHHMLVRTAARLCERVTVLVLASRVESLLLGDRVAWMREVHAPDGNVEVVGGMDDVPIDYQDPAVWDAHVKIFHHLLGGRPVDAVFTSEPYGDELARRLGARHARVDLERGLMPISGTAARRDPAAAWPYLAPPVRGGLARRVVIVGAESTGKTTLAEELAGALGARWVPEYGRDHTILLLAVARARASLSGIPDAGMADIEWTSADFLEIARRQNQLEDVEARAGGPVLICDTDAFATGVWHERYLGRRDPAVEAEARMHHLYVLTHPDDVPFEQDGLRDGERIRHWMHDRFVERLRETGRRFVLVRGDRAARLQAAREAVNDLLREGWGLADPLG